MLDTPVKTLSQRIHDANRIKAKRLNDHYAGAKTARMPKHYRTPTPCSCWMCGNPRKYFGERTMQERSAIQTEGWDG